MTLENYCPIAFRDIAGLVCTISLCIPVFLIAKLLFPWEHSLGHHIFTLLDLQKVLFLIDKLCCFGVLLQLVETWNAISPCVGHAIVLH